MLKKSNLYQTDSAVDLDGVLQKPMCRQ